MRSQPILHLKDLEEHLGPCQDSFKVLRKIQVNLIQAPIPGTPFAVIGSVGYRSESQPRYQEQYIALTMDGELYSQIDAKELTVIMRIAAALEKRWQDDGVQVCDVRLPKSHGFSGTKYGYRQVLELFPHLA